MSNPTDLGAWWASLTLVNAGLAQSKGRSGWYWWVWSLLLGPVATFLIVVWKPLAKPTSTKPASTEPTSIGRDSG